ncbi:MAG: hypothetical protein HKM98_03695 [Gammaproteobacteria bacterium]|nr:hypothetical protein [Gammaproteobacteria bacterium]
MLSASNVIPFPTRSRPCVRACPSCGTHTALWRIGRLLWGHCREHEVRWVAADLQHRLPGTVDLPQMRKRLEHLSEFEEISH